MVQIYPLLGVSSPFDPSNRYTTSWLLPPIFLASLRLLFSLYAFTAIFFIWGWNGTHYDSSENRGWFSYFTNLTYCGLAFYFLFGALHTFSYARTGRSWLQNWPRPLQALHAIFYTSIVCFPVVVTIVFWAVLYHDPWFTVVFDAWSNTSEHALNTLFAFSEIILPRTFPPPPLHLLVLIILLLLYLALAYITHATQGFYPYSFLDTSKGSGHIAGYAFGILAGMLIVFGVVWCLIRLREWVTVKVLGMEGKLVEREKRRGDVEMSEGII